MTSLGEERGERRFVLLLAAAVAVALGLRLPGLFTDFWLDEIWSLQFARRAASLWDLFLGEGFQHDNNHLLNTLSLYLIGERASWTVYRIPALVAGVVSVGLAVGLARRSFATRIATGVLFAASFFLVVYSTEARGYGPALCFALLGYAVLRGFLDRPSLGWAAAFWLAVVLGFSSQLGFAHFYLGAGLWSAVRLLGPPGAARRNLRSFCLLHGVPLAFLLGLYAGVLRRLQIGGGDPWHWDRVADEALAWTLGYPTGLLPPALVLAALAALLAWDLRSLHREGDDEWVLFAGVIVLGPLSTLTLFTLPVLYPRYFLLPLAFLLLVLGRTLGRLAAAGRGGPWAAGALLLLFASGNLAHLLPFYAHGRGLHRRAVEEIAAAERAARPAPGAVGRPLVIDVATDHPFRNPLLLGFYERKLGDGTHFRTWLLQTLAQGRGPRGGVRWLITHSQEYDPKPAESLRVGRRRYALWRHYPCYGPSGMHWFIYRRIENRGASSGP